MPVRESAAGRWPCRTFSMPERRDRHVHALLDLQRELARGDLVDAAAGDDQPLAAGSVRGGVREARSRWASAPSITRLRVAASARAGDRREREQRRDVADRVAPRRVRAAACATTRSAAGASSGMRGDRGSCARVRRRAARRASPPCRPRGRPRSARRRAAGRALPRTRRGRGAPSSAAPAIAACSLVPQPVSDHRPAPRGSHSRGLERRRRREDRRHEPRLGQDHLLHRPRRAVAQLGHVAHGRRRYRPGGPVDRATSTPMNRATLELFARWTAAARPLRAQLEDAICAAITGGGLPPGDPPARLARAGESLGSRAAWSARPTRRSPPRAGSRSATGRAPVVRASRGGAATAPQRAEPPRRAVPPTPRSPAPRSGPDARPRPICRASRAARWARRAAAGAGRDAGRGARLRRSARRRRSCAPSWRRTWCGCAASAPRPATSSSPAATRRGCGSPAGCWRRAARRRVAVEDPSLDDALGDDPLRRAGGRRLPVDGTARASTARLDADAVARHARAPVPDRRGARARSAAARCSRGAAMRDRGRLRLRVPLRPRAGAARCSGSRPTGSSTSARRRRRSRPRCGSAGCVAPAGARARRSRAERWAVDSGGPAIARARLRPPARHRRGRPPPAPHPPRVPRAPRPAGRGARRAAAGVPRRGRRRRPAPAAAAAAGHGRGRGGQRLASAADPHPRPRRLPAAPRPRSPRWSSATGGSGRRRSTPPSTAMRGRDRGGAVTRRVTLATVAEALGVSAMTVSNAYNRPEKLSPELRERVLAKATELGYAGPHATARSLRRGSAGALGVVLGETLPYAFEDPAALEFLSGLARASVDSGIALHMVPRRRRPGARARRGRRRVRAVRAARRAPDGRRPAAAQRAAGRPGRAGAARATRWWRSTSGRRRVPRPSTCSGSATPGSARSRSRSGSSRTAPTAPSRRTPSPPTA